MEIQSLLQYKYPLNSFIITILIFIGIFGKLTWITKRSVWYDWTKKQDKKID